MLQTVWVFAIATIGRTAARLNIGCIPVLWTDSAQKGCWVERPCTDFHIKWLHDNAALAGPIILKGENQPLKRTDVGHILVGHSTTSGL